MSGIRSGGVPQDAATYTENAFGQVLSEQGSKALFYHLRENHGVSGADLFDRPAEFAKALATIMGEYGSSLLLKRVYEAARTSLQ